jgi:2-dehydro-3-deoxygalactonokinase
LKNFPSGHVMNKTPEMFLSCDWGTSALRLRLVAAATETTIAGVSSGEGIAKVFAQWQQRQNEDRVSFYCAFLQQHIASLAGKTRISLQGLPVVVSGMASSAIGLVELPYKDAPFLLNGNDLMINRLQATSFFPHDVYLVSGVKTESDAMRGEETQLIGSLHSGDLTAEEQMVLLPGTHSKHVLVQGNKAVSFKTYMTGEFFDLLSQKSILSVSVEKEREGNDRKGFEEGITDSGKAGLLNTCFRVRTNQLFGRLNKEQNFRYLSGLLIGSELRELSSKSQLPVTVVGSERLLLSYAEALRLLFPGKEVRTIHESEATVKGHCQIFNRMKAPC